MTLVMWFVKKLTPNGERKTVGDFPKIEITEQLAKQRTE